LAQKSYKKKIHNNILVYQTNKLPTGMRMSRIMKIIEKKVPKHFLKEIESLVIADISKFTDEERMLEGNTVFISNEHYCEDLLIENFIITVGESLFNKYDYMIYDRKIKDEFIEKRRDLYYDLVEIHKDIAFSDFLSLDAPHDFTRAIRKLDFDDVIYNTQKHFVNYDSSLSLKNYFSHLFNSFIERELDKRSFKAFDLVVREVGRKCKENKDHEQID